MRPYQSVEAWLDHEFIGELRHIEAKRVYTHTEEIENPYRQMNYWSLVTFEYTSTRIVADS